MAGDASWKPIEGTVVAITHDRYFLDNVAGWILELDRGRGIPYEGNYSGWLEQKQKRLAQEEPRGKTQQQALQRELEWVRESPRARQAKGKARLHAYENCWPKREAREPGPARSSFPRPRLGDLVIEADHRPEGFGDAAD